MKRRNSLVIALVIAVLAVSPGCAKKDAEKLTLKKILNASAHRSGVFRYRDETPASIFGKGQSVAVRGLIEDDFRFKARISLNGIDVIDEVVNDDALAVRFLDPSLIPNFTEPSGGTPEIRQALAAKFWVVDPAGAPVLGDAAVEDRVLGVDPIVDSLSVVEYARLAVDQAAGVSRFNEESLEYRPKEDPFPKPAKGSGIDRWDLVPPSLPRADAQDTSGQGGNVKLAKTAVFRKMAIYIKDNKLFQIREQIAAEFDLVEDFQTYIERLSKEAGDDVEKQVKTALASVKDDKQLSQILLLALNQALTQSGEETIRYRSMVYEYSKQGEKVVADLPVGSDVRKGSLDFFGVNAKKKDAPRPAAGGAEGAESTSTTAPADASSTPSTTTP